MKKVNLLHTQGLYYEYDGLKFKSKEEIKSYVDSTKKSGKGISEEKIVEDAKATEEIAEADAIAKEKAKSSRENIGDIKSDEINKRKATKFWWLA